MASQQDLTDFKSTEKRQNTENGFASPTKRRKNENNSSAEVTQPLVGSHPLCFSNVQNVRVG